MLAPQPCLGVADVPCAIWAMGRNKLVGRNFAGTQAGFDAAKAYVGTNGYIQINGGCEGAITIGTLQDSVFVYAYDSAKWTIYGKAGSMRDRAGQARFDVDSLGVAITGKAVISDSLRSLSGDINGPLSVQGDINMGSGSDVNFTGANARISFDGSSTNLITATHSTGTVRIAAGGGLQKFEANTTGVDVSGALTATGKITAGDSTRSNKGIYVGGQIVNKILRASATLNFDLQSVSSQDLTITVTGAASGDEVSIGVPAASVAASTLFFGWVSAANTVTIRAVRTCDATPDPASGTFKVTVIQ